MKFRIIYFCIILIIIIIGVLINEYIIRLHLLNNSDLISKENNSFIQELKKTQESDSIIDLFLNNKMEFIFEEKNVFLNSEQENLKKIRNKLLEFDKTAKDFDIKKTKLENYYEVKIKDKSFFIDKDVSHVFIGQAVLINKNGTMDFINENEITRKRRLFINSLDEKELIKFESKNEIKKLYIFTDITCPYCQKLHKDIDKINDSGYTIYYIPFPRKESKILDQVMNNLWCKKEKDEYSKAIKNPEKYIKEKNNEYCEKKYTEYYKLMGDYLDAPGTPFILNQNGDLIGGYEGYSMFLLRANK